MIQIEESCVHVTLTTANEMYRFLNTYNHHSEYTTEMYQMLDEAKDKDYEPVFHNIGVKEEGDTIVYTILPFNDIPGKVGAYCPRTMKLLIDWLKEFK